MGWGFGAGWGVVCFLVQFLSFELLQFQLEEEINIVTVRKMHKITPTAENLPPPAAAVGLLGSCSLRYINSYHTWLPTQLWASTLLADKIKLSLITVTFTMNEVFPCISLKKLGEAAITVKGVRNWKMRVAFSCEEQCVSSESFSFSNSGALSVT